MSDTPEAAQQRYNHFVGEVRRKKRLWALQNAQGLAQWGDVDITVVPIWSDAESAQCGATSMFKGYRPLQVTVETFTETWVPQLVDRGVWVSINPTADMTGIDVPADSLARELSIADA